MIFQTRPIAVLMTIFLLILTSCNSDVEEATVELKFTLTYEDTPLVSFNEVNYPLGYKVFFTKYSLYLSDIMLTSPEGDHELSQVEFLDLLTGVEDENSAKEGKTLVYQNVPVRTYNGLSFNIGVPSDVNATEPAAYSVDNPLSNNGEYWVGWTSYIFHKIEGKVDADGDDTPEAGLALHLGSDQAFRNVHVNVPISIDKERETISINFDLADNLNIDGSYFDILATPQIHHLGVLPKALPILDSTVENISITEL